MKRWIVPLVLVLAVTGAVLLVTRSRGEQPAAATPLPTTPVTRGDLLTSVQQPGQLGYTGSVRLAGARQGTITALPVPGQVFTLGQPVYAVDQRPIPLLLGALPLYRPLRTATVGVDVRQLETNLVSMGYAHLTPDDSYTPATASAVKRWQRALGVPETGSVEPGDALVAPTPVRVTTVNGFVGAPARPGDPVVTGSSTEHGVHVELDRRYRSLAKVDQTVGIELFGGKKVDGVVRAIAATATAGSPQQPQTIGVDIAVTSPEAQLDGVFEGPVSVLFPGESRHNVLTVPIEALTVVPGGAYAVVAVDNGVRRTIEVRPGLFTASRVEISGQGIAEGLPVEVPTL